MNTVEVLPNLESVFPGGHALVSDEQLPTYCGHVHKAHEQYPGKWVYPFPSEAGARRALERMEGIRNDRNTSINQ